MHNIKTILYQIKIVQSIKIRHENQNKYNSVHQKLPKTEEVSTTIQKYQVYINTTRGVKPQIIRKYNQSKSIKILKKQH